MRSEASDKEAYRSRPSETQQLLKLQLLNILSPETTLAANFNLL